MYAPFSHQSKEALKHALKASGMPSGYYEPTEFEKRCGVDPTRFPQYFQIHRNGLVSLLPKFRDECNEHFAWVRLNHAALGIVHN